MKKFFALLSCLAAASFFFYTISQLTIFSLMASKVAQAFQLSNFEVSLLSSTYLCSNAFWLLPAGLMLDRFGCRKTALIFMGLCVLSDFFLMASPSIVFEILIRLIQGAGSAFSLLVSLRLATQLFRAAAGFAVGAVISLGMLGGTFTENFFSWMLQNCGWRASIGAQGILGIVFFVFMLMFLKDGVASYSNEKISKELSKLFCKLKTILANVKNWKCGIYIGLMNSPIFVLAALWGNAYLISVKKLSPTLAALMISLIFVGETIGSPIFGWFSDKMHSRKASMMIGAILAAMDMLLILFLKGDVFYFTALFFGLGFAIAAQVVAYPLIIESNSASLASAVSGFGSLLSNLTGALMQMVFGWTVSMATSRSLQTQQHNSFSHAMLLIWIGFIVSFFLSFLMKDPKKLDSAL